MSIIGATASFFKIEVPSTSSTLDGLSATLRYSLRRANAWRGQLERPPLNGTAFLRGLLDNAA